MSVVTMADSGSPKKHLLNGSSSNHFPSNCRSLGRRLSEPSLLLSLQFDLLSLPPFLSKDDTYAVIDHEGSGRSLATTLGPTYVSRPRFDPRQLLDPKGYNTVHQKKEQDSLVEVRKASPHALTLEFTDKSQKRERNESEEYGMGNMIERVHNITDRQERPYKKQKTGQSDDGEKNTKAGFSGGGKGGEISEYMRQKREEGKKDSGPLNTVIDLTEGEIYPEMWHATQSRANCAV